ncbi:MAG: hypothetical protein ACKO0M_01870 [Cyanobium sp.]
MVRLEELEALDLVLWLQHGATAAFLVGTNQSTISRRSQRVLTTFQGRLLRGRHGWKVKSPLLSLLDLQRQIHQLVRLRRRSGLRLNVPFWSRRLVQGPAPEGWLINPEQGPLVCEQPLELLRSHVIDACLVTPTQLEDRETADLVLFDLYSTRIDLHLLTGRADPSPDPSSEAALDLLHGGRLELPPFLPSSCCASSRRRFEEIRSRFALADSEPGGREGSPLPSLAFLTPVMAMALDGPRPQRLPLQLDWPYRETLAVLREHADLPAIQLLADHLRVGLTQAVRALDTESAVPPAGDRPEALRAAPLHRRQDRAHR